MKRGNLSRRGFLQRSLAALTAAGLPAWYGREVLAQKTGEPAQPAPSDRITIGIVGIGEPGTKPQPRGVQLFNDFKGQKDVQFVAACDVDSGRLDLGAKMIGEHYKSECQKFADYRKMLERDDINAVIIATPDHWHSLIALEAMRRGKDVYCEKPLTLFIDEGKALVKMAAEKKIIFQTGSQQRSADQFRLACELIRNGRIGKVKRIETRIGTNPKGGPYKPCEPHKELDFDFWLGPTPESVFAVKDYCEEMIHYHYRWNYNWSGGKLTDWGAHHNDIAQWALGKDDSGPIAVEGTGEEPSKEKYAYNCHPTFRVVYTYDMGADCKFAEKSVEVVCTHMRSEGSPDPKETVLKEGEKARKIDHDNGILFVGEGGQWIFVNRSGIVGSDEKLIKEPLPNDAVRLPVSTNHARNFLDCVKERKKQPICDVVVGHRSVTVCHLGAIALRSGKKLQWDPVKEVFVGDADANKWLSREMRAPWKLEG